MNNIRAYRYYFRLLSLSVKQDHFVTLSEVADILCSTPRHARTLLKTLQQLDWLVWLPKVGRNQRSVLRLNYDLTELQHLIAAQYIAEGNYEQALSILSGDQLQFSLLLQKTSGATLREGQLHIQLTYQRKLEALLPHRPLRNSERFLVRQIFDCLTRCDKNGQIHPQLAHHWQSNYDATEWRFYLRPQLKFHSNEIINAQAVSQLFIQLQTLPEYSKELAHLKTVSTHHQSIIFELNCPDLGFAALLSDLRYSIQPVSQLKDTKPTSLVGSGSFQIVEHSEKRLRLQAFEHTFALRPLTDTVTIWKISHSPSERIHLDKYLRENKNEMKGVQPITQSACLSLDKKSKHQQGPFSANSPQESLESSVQTRIENGCLYLLYNLGTGKTALTQAHRKYLSRILSADLILKEEKLSDLLLAAVPAFNLLPCWTKILSNSAEAVVLPPRLDIAVYDHLVILDCAEAIAKALRQLGVECQINIYSFAELHDKAEHNKLHEDIIIGNINVDDNLPISVFRWFYSNGILHQALSSDAKIWLATELKKIRENQTADAYLPALECLATSMICENWISPLFHHRQTLQWRGVLQGVSITDWSWPDFKNVWTDEE